MSNTRISSTDEIIADIKAGRMVVLVDEEDRENEGDLLMAAEFVTPESINFMARYGRGLICLSMTKERVQQLGLRLMAQDNASRHQTAFTVSIEAREGFWASLSDDLNTPEALSEIFTLITDLNAQDDHVALTREERDAVLAELNTYADLVTNLQARASGGLRMTGAAGGRAAR